jgi:hypothetical protein
MAEREDLKGRRLKQWVKKCLTSGDFESGLKELRQLPARKVINSLFSFLYHTDEQMRWRAIAMMGIVVADLADKEMESARVIVRRLMWNLNDESGGIGWGSAEAMGEILAHDKGLATEYASILISYARENGNFQEHELMQRGVLWGIARLAKEWPELAVGAIGPVMPFLSSGDASARGLAARIMGLLRVREAHALLVALLRDGEEFATYVDGVLVKRTVKKTAQEALREIG